MTTHRKKILIIETVTNILDLMNEGVLSKEAANSIIEQLNNEYHKLK